MVRISGTFATEARRTQRKEFGLANTTHNLNELSGSIIACAIEVHKALGPGLLESAYEECLCHELSLRRIPFERQVKLPIEFKNVQLDCGYRLDLLIANSVIVELKSVEAITNIHRAQLLTYLKLQNCWLGLLVNFNVARLVDGVIRIVNGDNS